MDDLIDYSNLVFHEQVGEGGFGSVNRVTFKTPYKGYAEAAAKSVVDFRKEEVEILAKISHPNVVRLIGFYKNGPVKIILLEYANCGSLHDFLSDETKPLPDDLKRKWIRESALGIQHPHASSCLHRDIKAPNCLLFDASSVLKLSDFGLARETDHSVTMSSQKGTYQYMAPELINTDDRHRTPYSKFADIYAYGMLVLEICTRKPPFQSLDYAYVIYNVGMGTLKPSIPADCPKDLAELMKHCWVENPRRRPTMDIIVELLIGGDEAVLGDLEDQYQPRPQEASASELQPWQTANEIHPTYQGKAIRADIVACCPNDDLIIADVSKLYLLRRSRSGDGKTKAMTVPALAEHEKQLGCVSGIAVSPQGHVIVVDNTRFVKVFDSKGRFSHWFSTETVEDAPSRQGIELSCVAMDRDGHILVGDRWRGIVTLHKCPSGEVITTVPCSLVRACNNRIVVNSKRQIMCHFLSNEVCHRIVAIDYSGETEAVLLRVPQGMSVLGVWQRGIACDAEDNLYMSMKVAKGSKIINTIHKYSAIGEFQGSITDGIYFPYNLTVSSDGRSLVVANDRSVLTYNLRG